MADDIRAWLRKLSLEQYAQIFAENDVDVDVLPHITDEDLKELGVTIGGRRKILAAIASATTGTSPLAKSATSGLEAAAERRQVTVMFCDMAGSTALSTQLDAEDMRDVILAYQTTASEAIKRHDGFIARYMGDGILVYFGYPQARENDARRAIAAGLSTIADVLEIDLPQLERIGEKLAVRVGIASGEAIVGDIVGEGASQEAAITGEAPNLAARVQSVAEPNTVAISESTYRLVERVCSVQELPPTSLKGFASPQRVFRVLPGNECQEDKFDPKTQATRFVGRRHEIRTITEVGSDIAQSDIGQVIVVRGEAGIGKTRLTAESATALRALGYRTYKGLILDFGAEQGRDAIRSILRAIVADHVDDLDADSLEATSHIVESGLLDSSCAIFLNDLLWIEQKASDETVLRAMDSDTRKSGKIATIKQLVERVALRRKVLILVEDVHWADKEALESLAAIASVCKSAPFLLIMTSRIEGDQLDHVWRAHAGNIRLMTLDLAPLDTDDALELARSFQVLEDAALQRFVEKSEGNPLFLEQMLRNAADGGSQGIPPTLQTLILARLDKLPPRDRLAAQAGATIGQRFRVDLLRYMIQDDAYSFDKLVQHNLVRPDGEVMQFTHALIQDVAYGSQLRATQRKMHKAAATWFDQRDPILHAKHLELAEDPAAPSAYLDAAKSELYHYRHEHALHLIERGLHLATTPANKFDLTFQKGQILHDQGHIGRAGEAFASALEWAENDGDRCRVWIEQAAGLRIEDRYDEALALLEQAKAVAKRENLIAEQAKIHHVRGNIFFPMGRIEDCAAEHESSLRYATEVGSSETKANALSGLADANYVAGRMASAFKYFDECVKLAHGAALERIKVVNQSMIGFSRLYLNQIHEALDDARESIVAADRIGHQRARMLGETLAAWVWIEMAEYGHAREHAERALNLSQQLGAPRFEAQSIMFLAKIIRSESGRDESIAELEKALSISAEVGHGFVGARIAGELALSSSNDETKRQFLADGEQMLAAGSVAHNHLVFYPTAIDVSLELADWASTGRFATALEDLCIDEPLPWCRFFAQRGRRLAEWHTGNHAESTVAALTELQAEARCAGLIAAGRAINDALGDR